MELSRSNSTYKPYVARRSSLVSAAGHRRLAWQDNPGLNELAPPQLDESPMLAFFDVQVPVGQVPTHSGLSQTRSTVPSTKPALGWMSAFAVIAGFALSVAALTTGGPLPAGQSVSPMANETPRRPPVPDVSGARQSSPTRSGDDTRRQAHRRTDFKPTRIRTEPGPARKRLAITADNPPPANVGAAPGTLRINSRPWCDIFVDGQSRGVTPNFGISLAPGRHTVKLVNKAMGLSKTFSVKIGSRSIVTKILNLGG